MHQQPSAQSHARVPWRSFACPRRARPTYPPTRTRTIRFIAQIVPLHVARNLLRGPWYGGLMTTRFRFGVSTSEASSAAEWAAKAQRVEALGYDVLLVADHFGPLLSPTLAMVAAASETERLNVGSFVFDNDFRHPALLAQEAATLDLLTDGRFELGIGAGWLKDEYDRVGIPWEGGGVRAEKLEEAVHLIKSLLKDGEASFDGRHYRVRDLRGLAARVRRPHPRIVIGGGGRRVLSIAAREADTISVMPRARRDGGLASDFTARDYDEKISWIRAAAGSRFGDIELNVLVQVVAVTDDVEAEAARVASEWDSDADTILDSPLILIGSVDEIVNRVRQRRERYGFTYLTVFEKDMERFAPIAVRLRGASS